MLQPLRNKHISYLQVLTKKKLQDLVREIDPNEQLDEDVEEVSFFMMEAHVTLHV